MKYLTITENDMNNGEGIRTVLWVAGCTHACPGCHNKHTWGFNQGISPDWSLITKLLDSLSEDHVDGITYSGGDPMHPENVQDIAQTVGYVREFWSHKTQWVYTGYTLEELKARNDIYTDYILENIDVLVDGKYVEELNSPEIPWVGSSNQRVIKLKED